MTDAKSRRGAALAALVVTTALFPAACAQTPPATAATAAAAGAGAVFSVGSDGRSIVMQPAAAAGAGRSATAQVCRLDAPATRARLSADGLSLLVDSNGYVPLSALQGCGQAPLAVRRVPARGGLLEDINAARGLYIGLVAVTTQPFAWLAVVSSLDSARNRMALPGAWREADSGARRRELAFAYADDVGPFARFSPDGRYLTPSGAADCAEDAHPGVWDVQSGRKVVLGGDPAARDAACRALFEAPALR